MATNTYAKGQSVKLSTNTKMFVYKIRMSTKKTMQLKNI